jgi:hypothetical protein
MYAYQGWAGGAVAVYACAGRRGDSMGSNWRHNDMFYHHTDRQGILYFVTRDCSMLSKP